jgi:cysteine desulfurase
MLFHTDAAQAAGKISLDVEAMGIDLLSLSAHKIYGPKGVGALYVRRREPRVRLEPILDGGGHEGGLRSGTLPVPLVVGFGKACELCRQEMTAEAERLRGLRERLRGGIMDRLSDVYLNGHPTERLPGTLNLSFAYVKGDALMMGLKNVAISSGSACTSASLEPSYVLKALGVDDELAHSSIRFGLGRFNTEEEVDYVIDEVARTVRRLREISPMYEMAQREIGKAQG